MRGDKIDDARAAASALVDRLEPGDLLTVISYNTSATTHLERFEIGDSRDEAHNAISSDPASRKGALDQITWAIECSEALGSEVLCGPFHQPLAVFSGEGPTEEELGHGIEVHRQAADRAA